MKKVILSTAAALAFTAGLALTPAADAQLIVRVGPPARVIEPVPPPRPGYVWREGYHRWDGARYVWVPGEYIVERPGGHWVQGHWDRRHGGWVWVEGHWR